MLKWGRLEVSSGFLLLVSLLLYLCDERMVLLGLAACCLHELGHLAAIRMAGGHVGKLRLTAAGAELRMEEDRPLSYARELLCTAAGPAVNLCLACLAARAGIALWAGINLILGCFHLLPLPFLDGGRALYSVLCILGQEDRAERLCRVLGLILSAGVLTLGMVVAAATRGNVTLLILGLWIFHAFGRQKGLSTSV